MIAQDTIKYGVDLYGRGVLSDPLQQLHEIEDFHWTHILYMYPDEVDARLIEGMAKLPKALPYSDIPTQYASNRMLQLMSRRGNREGVAILMKKVQGTFSYPTLRTTFIVGFLTEEEADFSELMQLIEDVHWGRMGALPYSPGEDTPAYSIDGAVDEGVKEARLAQLMRRQEEISLENQKRMIDKIIEAFVEDQEGFTSVCCGHGANSALGEVDGIVMFKSECFIEFGSFVRV